MTEVDYVNVIPFYRKQIKNKIKFLKVSALSRAINVEYSALWRVLTDIKVDSRIDLSIVEKLEEIGVLVPPVYFMKNEEVAKNG